MNHRFLPHRFLAIVLFGCAWMACAGMAHASDSLRVGNRLLMVGDTAAHVQELLGRPSYRAHRSSSHRGHRHSRTRGGAGGQRWQYRRDGRIIVVTIVDGLVTDIDERRS